MAATYASTLAVCIASLAIGQAAMTLCGRRRWSWLSPAVGLALVAALCWGTVRLPGDGVVSAIALAALTLAAIVLLRGRVEGVEEAVRAGAPVALLALAAASLPFLVEGRFGILGTSFNPDMSQHLLVADQLAHGDDGQLVSQGYPLGPHAIVVALNKGLGAGLVQGFDGLTLAITVLAALTALIAFRELGPGRRLIGALLVGLPYMVASYLAQGAFKETMQALLVLAFALGLRELSRSGPEHEGRSPLAAVPLALIAAGSLYVYSFPGLSWLAAALVFWAGAELFGAQSESARAVALRRAARPAAMALIVFAVAAAPELARMLDFRHFETFDPSGPGLGNLFVPITPFEALGIWPTGDFRLTPGDGAVPAVGYYAGVALGLVLLAYGLAWCALRRESALLSASLAAMLVYASADVAGTPYTAAKAVAMLAPLAMLIIVLPLLSPPEARFGGASFAEPLRPIIGLGFAIAAAGCSLLALANAPVGPSSYSPALTGLRPFIAHDSTLVLAPADLLNDQHGVPYLAWELRGGRVCIRGAGGPSGATPPPGVRFVISEREAGRGPPLAGLRLDRNAGPYLLWRRTGAVRGSSPCPLIAVRQARKGEKQG